MLEWMLDPSVDYLNHGAFGACPRPVIEEQRRLQDLMESNPTRFLARELDALLDQARVRMAEFVGADPDGLVFIDNATTGVNVALRSIELAPGDEILVTNHGYNACRNAAEVVGMERGARVVTAPIPFPIGSASEVPAAVMEKVGERTRVVLVDHVTSPTGIVLPVAEIARRLRDTRIVLIVDGAHAPGMLALDVAATGAGFYTGNCHKWMCTPKGSAFVWVDPALRDRVFPPAVSHGWNDPSPGRSRYQKLFSWTGTRDPSAVLTVPFAIDLIEASIDGGWKALRDRNHRVVLAGRDAICHALGLRPPAPDEMLGSLSSMVLGPSVPTDGPLDPLCGMLAERHKIEVPIFSWPDPALRILRISAQAYNSLDQYLRLAEVVVAELEREAAGGRTRE